MKIRCIIHIDFNRMLRRWVKLKTRFPFTFWWLKSTVKRHKSFSFLSAWQPINQTEVDSFRHSGIFTIIIHLKTGTILEITRNCSTIPTRGSSPSSTHLTCRACQGRSLSFVMAVGLHMLNLADNGKHYYRDWTGFWNGILIQLIQCSPTLIQVWELVSWKHSNRTFKMLTVNTDIHYHHHQYAVIMLLCLNTRESRACIPVPKSISAERPILSMSEMHDETVYGIGYSNLPVNCRSHSL